MGEHDVSPGSRAAADQRFRLADRHCVLCDDCRDIVTRRTIATEREACEAAVIAELRRMKLLAGGPYWLDEADVRAAIRARGEA